MTTAQLKVFDRLTGKVADKTIQNYKGSFKRAKDIIGKTRLTTFKTVINKINKAIDNEAVRGGIYTAIIKYLELKSRTELTTQAQDKSLKASQRAFIAYKQEGTKQKKIVNETPKVLSDKLKSLNYKTLQRKYVKYVKGKDYKISNGELLLGFYLLQPPRRLDYTNLVYVASSGIPADKTQNYLLKNSKVLFNKSTKVRKDIQQVVPIKNANLKKIIKQQNYSENDSVFSMSKRTLQRKLQKATTDILGTSLNIQEIRILHSTATFKGTKKQMKEMEEDAKAMNHTVRTKMNNYIRD